MYLQKIDGVLDGQFVKIKYDCSGRFERCGQEWELKLKDAVKNFTNNKGEHICRKCQLKLNNPARRKDVQEKTKKTNLEKYGTECSLNTPEHIATRNEKMFGTQEAIDARNEKTKKTNLKLYGAEHIMKTDEGKKRQKNTMQENHGVDYPLQNEQIKEKTRLTCQERYDVDNPGQSPEVRIKMAQTTLDRYGVEYYNQLPEMKDYLRNNCTIWLAESYAAGGPNAEKPRPKEWNEKQRETVIMLILEGKWKAGHRNTWRGYYTSSGKCRRNVSCFRSGFELMYHYYLDNDAKVEWYDYEPFSIRYQQDNGESHNYVPDFIVKYYDDEIIHIREVKADYLHDSTDTKAKYFAAREFVKTEMNMDYSILLKGDIYALGLDFEVIKSLPCVEITNNPRNK